VGLDDFHDRHGPYHTAERLPREVPREGSRETQSFSRIPHISATVAPTWLFPFGCY